MTRLTGIAQIESAITRYQTQYGKWPGQDTKRPQSTSALTEQLVKQGNISTLPTDPDANSIVF